MTMTESAVDLAEADATEAVIEQTPEVAAAALEAPEQIAADDPRARAMWATIARTAIAQNASDYYETIARALGAPTIKSLKETKDLAGVKTTRYRIMFDVKRSLADNDGEPTATEIREYLKSILRKKDKGFLEAIERRESSIDYATEPPEQPIVTSHFRF